LSSTEEIMDVFEDDIAGKCRAVSSTPQGRAAFYAGLPGDGMSIRRLYHGIMTEDDESLLGRIVAVDRESGIEY